MKDIERPERTILKNAFIDPEPDWRDEWWGMPAFEMRDCRPNYKIVVNFMSA